MKRAVRSRSGSTLGFSQPLSGFLARPSFAALFRAATVPGILPLELSPRKDRAPLSRPLCSPAVIHQRAEPYCPSALSSPVSPTPALLTQLPGSPERLWTPFFTNRSLLPGCPGLRAAESIHSASFTDFEASIPSRIRLHQSELPRPGDRYSWVSSPLESSPSTPRVLYPPRPRGPEPVPPSEDFGAATLETSSLKSRVKPS